VGSLHKELVGVLKQLNAPYEIIIVDDGSTDKTLAMLTKLSPVKIIQFRRNFGQTAALDAGIKAARGNYIVTMDADGQNDPHDIPRLIEALEKDNLDVVSGWRKKRKDPLLKRLASKAAALVRKILIDDGIHDSGCTLKIYKRECFKHVDLVGEMHRFIPALLKIKGFTVGEIVVNHRPREKGYTKYTWTRGIKGILDMFSVWFWKKYAHRPLHLFGGFGVILFAIALIGGTYLAYQSLVVDLDLSDTALTELVMFSFLIGIQFFVFGLLADTLSKNYFAATKTQAYDIKDITENTK